VDIEAGVTAPIPNVAHSRRPPIPTNAKKTLSSHHAQCDRMKLTTGVGGAQKKIHDTPTSHEENLDPAKAIRKRGRSSTTNASPGGSANGPVTKKQNTRTSRGRRSSVSDVLMEDPFEHDGVKYLLPDVEDALTPSGECADLLFTSKDDHCLIRKSQGPLDASKFTTGVSVFDSDCQSEVEHVSDYVTDIFQRLFDAEVSVVRDFRANDLA
jgi:hypothetical protein